MKTLEQNIEESATTDISSLEKFARNLRFFSDKVNFFSDKEKKIEEYLNDLKQFHKKLLERVHNRGIDTTKLTKKDRKLIKSLIKKNRRKTKGLDICNGFCITKRLPPKHMNSIAEIEVAILYLEYQFAIISRTSQLAEIDLQNAMQQGELLLQMTSNISKEIQDSAMSVIQNIK